MAANKWCLTFTNLLINNLFWRVFLFQFADSSLGLHFFCMQTIFTLHLFLKAILKPHLRLHLISKISPIFFIPWTSKNSVKSQLVNHPYLERNLNLLLLSLWGRYFLHIDPGHFGPACVSISRITTRTFADPESHTHCAFVDFLADSFNMTYAVQIL